MNVLVACEFSGVVRDEFTKLGHNAWSCDVSPTERPGKHLQGDIREFIKYRHWDILVAHPPCTYLTVSAEWAYKDGPYHQKVKPETLTGAARREAREQAIEFFLFLWNAGIPRIAIENPIGCMSSRLRKPDQIIQPYEFGHDASKSTCLWLQALPKLVPTDYVLPRLAKGKKRWSNQTDSGQNRVPPQCRERAGVRSVTYQGIARAMATQWGVQGV